MIKVDLITGFLGAGKTTFIRKYAGYLMDSGLKIGIIENDYGAVNVDMMLLSDLEGESCGIEMISGGCCEDCHRRRFKTKLIAMAMYGYDRVLVEPSGIFDAEEFFDILCEEPLDRWYEKGSVITVADALLDDDLSEDAEYILASQTAAAGCIILSRTQLAQTEKISGLANRLERLIKKYGFRRETLPEIISVPWDRLTNEHFERLASCGYCADTGAKRSGGDFESVYFMHSPLSPDELKRSAEKLFDDPGCGRIFRVKGFARSGEEWFELNAVRGNAELRPVSNGQEIVIVIGENLSRENAEKYFFGKPEQTPFADRAVK